MRDLTKKEKNTLTFLLQTQFYSLNLIKMYTKELRKKTVYHFFLVWTIFDIKMKEVNSRVAWIERIMLSEIKDTKDLHFIQSDLKHIQRCLSDIFSVLSDESFNTVKQYIISINSALYTMNGFLKKDANGIQKKIELNLLTKLH